MLGEIFEIMKLQEGDAWGDRSPDKYEAIQEKRKSRLYSSQGTSNMGKQDTTEILKHCLPYKKEEDEKKIEGTSTNCRTPDQTN